MTMYDIAWQVATQFLDFVPAILTFFMFGSFFRSLIIND